MSMWFLFRIIVLAGMSGALMFCLCLMAKLSLAFPPAAIAALPAGALLAALAAATMEDIVEWSFRRELGLPRHRR